MISYAYESLFAQNSIDKQYEIKVFDGELLESTITNESIYSESFEHRSPLCTDDSLQYGSCASGYVKFKVVNSVGTLKNKKLVISVTPHGGTKLQLGEFYVESDVLSGDRKSRSITAYDKLYEIINTDVLQWYGELNLPMTMKNFRDAFFNKFGVTQISATLCNDSMVITETIIAEQLSGMEVLSCILAGNGCVGAMTNEGEFKYITFTDYETKAFGKIYKQGSLVYEDYLVQPITSLHFFSNKIDIVVGADPQTSSNIYVMEDNFLFYDKIESDLRPYVQNIFDVIKLTPAFRPLKVETYGDPCIEVGDMITFETADGETVRTFVLDKVESGLQALSDKYDIEGTEYYEYDLNGGNSQIRRLWNNTIALEQEVATARCYVYAHRNVGRFNIGHTTRQTIITIPLASVDNTIPVFVATIPLTMDVDGEITFRYFLDDIEINENDNDTIYLTRGEQFVTISTFFEMPANSRKRFTVTAQTGYRESVEREHTAKIISFENYIQTGTYVEEPIDTTPPGAEIDIGKIRAMVFASGLASEQPWDGTITIVEDADDFTLVNLDFENASEEVSANTQVPTGGSITDNASDFDLVELVFEGAEDSIYVVTHAQSFPIITEEEEALITEDGIRFYTEGD